MTGRELAHNEKGIGISLLHRTEDLTLQFGTAIPNVSSALLGMGLNEEADSATLVLVSKTILSALWICQSEAFAIAASG